MILQIYDSAHAMDLTAWRLYLAEQNANGTPLSFLADCEPQTYQLTPEQIDAVFGINTIWSDSGDVTVTYDRQYLIHGWNAIGAYVSPTEEASDADMYFIDLGGTYYGGTIDFLSGVMTVTHMTFVGLEAADVGTRSEVRYADVGATGLRAGASVLSSHYRQISASATVTEGTFQVEDNLLTVYDNRFTSESEANEILADVEWCYPLRTPIEVQLTPQQIELLVGTNHIWSDEGNIVHVKIRTYENEEDSDVIDVDYITTIQYDGMMCGEGIIPKTEM